MPWPCSAEMRICWSIPRRVELGEARSRAARVSALLTTRMAGLLKRAEVGPDLLVGGDEPLLAVHHEEQQVALLDGQEHLLVEAQGIVPGHQAAGVDHLDRAVVGEVGRSRDAVAGDPRLVVDDGLPPADQAVEQGRLADVGAADDGDARRDAHLVRRRGGRLPGVGSLGFAYLGAAGPCAGRNLRLSLLGGRGWASLKSRLRWRLADAGEQHLDLLCELEDAAGAGPHQAMGLGLEDIEVVAQLAHRQQAVDSSSSSWTKQPNAVTPVTRPWKVSPTRSARNRTFFHCRRSRSACSARRSGGCLLRDRRQAEGEILRATGSLLAAQERLSTRWITKSG